MAANRGGSSSSHEANLRKLEAARRNRKIGRRNFWRLVLFTLFLVYPSISSTVLRSFVCDKVEGIWYLRADFSVQCYDSSYNLHASFAGLMVLLYPIGIPFFFGYLLHKYRSPIDRLEEKGIRAQLGFLYDGYERSAWYFELIDMLHKLALTSLIAFIPWKYQMVVAMMIVVSFIAVILIANPYLRKSDNRLHLISLVEILMMLYAGHIFNSINDEPDKFMEWLLSIILIGIVVGFFIWWLSITGHVVMKLLAKSNNTCIIACVKCFGYGKHVALEEYDNEEDRQKAIADLKNKQMKMDNFAVPRYIIRAGTKGGALGRTDVTHDDVELVRNAAWRPDNDGEAHRLDQLEQVEINPLHQTIVKEKLGKAANTNISAGPRRVDDYEFNSSTHITRSHNYNQQNIEMSNRRRRKDTSDSFY